MLERWHHEASINYGVANIKRLMLPLLVVETVPQEAVEEYHLKAYDTSERRRQLLFYLNYTMEDQCQLPLPPSSIPQNESKTSCRVQEKCLNLCGK